MNKKFILALLILYLALYNQAISPTLALVEPIVLEDTQFLNNQQVDLNKNYKEYWVIITAYSSSPDETDDTPYITASGAWVTDGGVASNFLPLGIRLKIPDLFGEKVFVVNDRMNDRFNDRIDVWFPDKDSAKRFGIKYGRILVFH